jgi:putative ABC transport system permease protein
MSPTHIILAIPLALKSLMLHKLRSGLTMLGIVFGVFSVIAMLAIGEGASAQAQQQVLELGATNIIVVSVKPPDGASATSPSGRRSQVERYGLLRSDYELLVDAIPTVSGATPVRESRQEVRNLHRTMHGRLVGCTPEYLDVNHLELTSGRFITDQDLKHQENVAVLGYETAEILFPRESPIGQRIQIKFRFYTVVGVTSERTASAAVGGSLSGQDYNKDIYIPMDTFSARLGEIDFQITAGSFKAEQVELNQITLRVEDRDAVIPTAEVVRETLARTHPDQKDYSVVVPLELLKQAEQLRQIFNIVLGSIAAISLLVGGIGIMNIMLATVTERTREIGIRRALGARRHDITLQFLTETIVLAGTGGAIGVILGLLTPYAFLGIRYVVDRFVLEGGTSGSDLGQMFAGMTPIVPLWSLPVAFGISVGVGVAFGLYPARSAAQLDPIEALRHE